jgi:small GTP-binding protein
VIEVLPLVSPNDRDPVPLAARSPASGLETIAAIAGRHQLDEIEQRARRARQQAGDDAVGVAVLGRFKAGKTTLLNQLLGADLLPVEAVPATAVITRLRYGAEPSIRVLPRSGTGFDITPAEVPEWATETGNTDNIRDVESIQVENPALGDLSHLVLVDTPGTGSSWDHNTATSLSWLPNVGAALIAINATQPLGRDDIGLIRLVQPHTPSIIVVLTKIDLLSDRDWCAVTAHVRGQLRELRRRAHPDNAAVLSG